MGLKLEQQLKKRRQFILDKSTELLKSGECDTITDSYLYIADNYLFCSLRTIYRALNHSKTVK
ncbi:MAG: hypothetical protein KGV44_12810 [Flavobacteriaceae bacterium]|nr:hypothetical protein [Flavobacteriaceae bacterium]